MFSVRRIIGNDWGSTSHSVWLRERASLEIDYAAYGEPDAIVGLATDPWVDFTEDGVLDFYDTQAFMAHLSAEDPEADRNNDSEWDYFDFLLFVADTATATQPLSPTGRRNAEENPFGLAGYRHDAITGLYHVRNRVLDPVQGRWLQRDPVGFVDGGNVYGYGGDTGSPIAGSDPYGLALYAIDGTWSRYKFPITNTKRLYDGSGERPKAFWHGPDLAASGYDARARVAAVHNRICRDWCKDRQPIHLVGWSRGAAIAILVSKQLDSDGCCCPFFRINGKTVGSGAAPVSIFGQSGCGPCMDHHRPVPVAFLGLFDAVGQITAAAGLGGNYTVPQNVARVAHATRSANLTALEAHGMPVINTPNMRVIFNYDGSGAGHADVGAFDPDRPRNDAFAWMLRQSRAAGIK